MAKHIDLAELKSKGLVVEDLDIDVNNKHVEPHPYLPGDPTPSGKVPYKAGDPQRLIIFEPQTYQELGLKEGDMVVFGNNEQKWRIVEIAGSAKGPSVFFAQHNNL